MFIRFLSLLSFHTFYKIGSFFYSFSSVLFLLSFFKFVYQIMESSNAIKAKMKKRRCFICLCKTLKIYSCTFRRGVRATLILIPLLGLHYFIMPFKPRGNQRMEYIYNIITAVLISFQVKSNAKRKSRKTSFRFL